MQRPGLRTVLSHFAVEKTEVAILLVSSPSGTVCTIEAMGDDYVTVTHLGATKYFAIEHIVAVWAMNQLKYQQTEEQT